MQTIHATTQAKRPDLIHSETELEQVLTQPRPELIEYIRTVSSPLVILGAGGKMGPTLAVLARRAAAAARHPLEVIAVSRFGDSAARQWLESRGIKTLSCDLLDAGALRKLPATENLIYLVGLKFGTAQNPAATWAINALVPAEVVERYPNARMVALSTGNVYPFSRVEQGGAVETAPLTPPGEYANATVARERIFEFCSARAGTPVALLRLLYAVELRYGVLMDLAWKLARGEPVDVTTGYFQCIWQGDANDMILRALPLASSPPSSWNLCQPEVFSVREIATRLAELMGCRAELVGQEASTALLANPAKLCSALGRPATPMETVLRWTAHWARSGGRSLNKPTHFEVRDGTY